MIAPIMKRITKISSNEIAQINFSTHFSWIKCLHFSCGLFSLLIAFFIFPIHNWTSVNCIFIFQPTCSPRSYLIIRWRSVTEFLTESLFLSRTLSFLSPLHSDHFVRMFSKLLEIVSATTSENLCELIAFVPGVSLPLSWYSQHIGYLSCREINHVHFHPELCGWFVADLSMSA